MQPRLLECLRIGSKFVILATGAERIECGFRSQHAGLDRCVAAFDAAHIEKAGVATDQCSARKYQLRQRLQSTGNDRARAIGNALATLKEFSDFRMCLVTLEFLIRRQIRIFIAKTNHITDRDLIVFHVVQKRTAVGIGIQRPAGSVNNQTRLMHLGIDFPQLLDADAVGLWIAILVQVELAHQLLAEMAASTFGKHRVLRVQLHAKLECRGWLPIVIDTHVAGSNTLYRAVAVVQNFCSRKAGKNFDTKCFCLLAQPTHDVT